MAFTDPQSVTINAIPYTMARIETDSMKAVYSTTDGNLKMTISHQPASTRIRRMVRLDQRVVAADPLSAVNTYQSLGVYVVIDQPTFGFTAAAIDNVVQGLKAWLTTGNDTKILGAES